MLQEIQKHMQGRKMHKRDTHDKHQSCLKTTVHMDKKNYRTDRWQGS